jgi:hypothetical protein
LIGIEALSLTLLCHALTGLLFVSTFITQGVALGWYVTALWAFIYNPCDGSSLDILENSEKSFFCGVNYMNNRFLRMKNALFTGKVRGKNYFDLSCPGERRGFDSYAITSSGMLRVKQEQLAFSLNPEI